MDLLYWKQSLYQHTKAGHVEPSRAATSLLLLLHCMTSLFIKYYLFHRLTYKYLEVE